MLPGAKILPRPDRWTPRSTLKKQSGEEEPRPATQTRTSSGEYTQGGSFTEAPKATTGSIPKLLLPTAREFSSEELSEVVKIQDKLREQLKQKRNFKVDESAGNNNIDRAAFHKTLTRYGVAMTERDRDLLFDFYDHSGDGSLDRVEFMRGVRGSEFVQTSRSYGLETPDLGYHDENPEGGLGHFVDLAGAERESAMKLGTPRCAKAWQQQRAVDGCPFGTDRRTFGGQWQYRTSSLVKAEPVVASRFGKTGFPARKELKDVLAVINEKLTERMKGGLAFTRMFNQFDTDKSGTIDREEFEKLLDIFNIALTDEETTVVFDHFGGEDGGIRYRPFVETVEKINAVHPLGGIAGTAFGVRPKNI